MTKAEVMSLSCLAEGWEGTAIRVNRESGDLPKGNIPSWIGVMKSEKDLKLILKRNLRIFVFLALIFLKLQK